ncbi:flagellar basal body P-ring formation chaperone FlgA [Acetobacter conturbans]|uniref:Flagellar basal body P-ring formation protein FlgA n=1 Tax=Acetobacter conturbans TaxID=1737472 RepID=A0ABX0JUZ8_9PROT|nr:flagellar basal body P-ring formation chaperone FlgA [Acetobacter conturbans]NHN87331.1 flagellar basal body P-ring formation protein FlgA [Acetobacter conturbans]
MNRLRLRLFLASCLIGGSIVSLPLNAATLRHASVLHHPQVRLSDLFNGLAPDQDCDIGPAPAPGQNIVIGAAQLQAIAQQYGVDWADISDMAQATVTRASHTISQDEIMPLIIAGLRDRGITDSATIELSTFSGPTVAADLTTRPQLTNIVYDASHGRFSAFFSVASADTTQSFRADGTVSSHVEVVTASHDLTAGQTIEAADLELTSLDSRSVPVKAILDPADITGHAVRRAISAHTPLTPEMTARVTVVDKGAPVVLDLSSTGLHLTASGVALDAGALGERIHVLNPLSKMVVVGEIIDRSRVAVSPGSSPMAADARELRAAGVRSQKNI